MKKQNFYRRLHLKKYYIHRWKRTMFGVKNIYIANVKFMSKFIFIWKVQILTNKKQRLNSVVKLWEVIERLELKKVNITFVIQLG